jgi:two-component system, NarL family, sensor histidine kinase LiaS
MRSLRRRFGTLRWRLMLSCFVAAFTAMISLAVTFVLVPGIISMMSPQRPVSLVQGLQTLAPKLAPSLRQAPPDQARLIATLETFRGPIVITEELTNNLHYSGSVVPGKNATLLVLGRDGQMLATLAAPSPSNGALDHLRILSGTRAVVAAALRNDTRSTDLIQNESGEPTVAAVPIIDTDGTVRGVLLMGTDLTPLVRPLYLENLLGLIPTIILFALIASIFGVIFGMLTARGLTRRLQRLTSAADAWSQGDFAASVRDPSPDELGQLARDLNRMAEQLRNLLRDQQQLAVVEERNRLARDLHDSVKQQMFALTMLVGSAQLEVEDQSEAQRILAEAERVASNAQQEMTALIQALRPVALANKDLGAALHELCSDWQQRTGIACGVDVADLLAVAPDAEQQVFRIVQEALANVAKHSGATHAEVHAADEQNTLVLRIRDNGRGFDMARAEGSGVGLSSMRERAESLGGSLRISSAAGGTRLALRVPLAQKRPTTRVGSQSD